MKKYIGACMFGLAATAATETTAADFRSFYNVAVENAHEVKGGLARVEAAGYEVHEARAAYLPQISFNYTDSDTHKNIEYSSQTAIDGNNTNYETTEQYWLVSQSLIDAPKAWALEAAKAGQRQALFESDSDRLAFGYDMLAQYLEALGMQERIDAAQAQLRYLKERTEREKRELDAGRIVPSVYAVTLSSLSEAEAEHARAMADYEAIQKNFCQLSTYTPCPLSVEPETIENSVLKVPHITKKEIERLESGLARHPDLQALSEAQNRVRNESAQASSGFLPIVSLEYENRTDDNGGSIFDGSSKIDTSILRLTARINLFEGGKKFAQRGRKQSELVSLQTEFDIRYRELTSDLNRALSSYYAAVYAESSLKAATRRQKTVVALAQQQVDAGFETFDKVLEVKAEEVRMQVSRHRAVRDAILAIADMEVASGRPPLRAIDALSGI